MSESSKLIETTKEAINLIVEQCAAEYDDLRELRRDVLRLFPKLFPGTKRGRRQDPIKRKIRQLAAAGHTNEQIAKQLVGEQVVESGKPYARKIVLDYIRETLRKPRKSHPRHIRRKPELISRRNES